MLVECQYMDMMEHHHKSIDLSKAMGLDLMPDTFNGYEDEGDEDIPDEDFPPIWGVIAVFPPVPTGSSDSEFGEAPMPYIIPLGQFTEYDDALKVYRALQNMDWTQPGYVIIPEDGEDLSTLINDWKKSTLFPQWNS